MEQTEEKTGFANMTAERHRAVASSGGKAAHRMGRAHKWTSETARIAGSKGGKKCHANRTAAKLSEGDATA